MLFIICMKEAYRLAGNLAEHNISSVGYNPQNFRMFPAEISLEILGTVSLSQERTDSETIFLKL